MIHLTQFGVNSIIKILQLLSNTGMPKIQRTRTCLLYTFSSDFLSRQRLDRNGDGEEVFN